MRAEWQMWDRAIPAQEVDLLIDKLEQLSFEEAGVSALGKKESCIRRSSISWVHDDAIKATLWTYIQQANRSSFNFDVTPFCEVQYTKYFAAENGHYDWHEDVLWDSQNMYDRKLSMTVQLSAPDEYDGGEFEFQRAEQPPAGRKNKGTILVFPSYLTHRVKPVTRGVRKSLVAWFEGPRWR